MWSLKTGIISSYDLPCKFWESNLCPPEEQSVLLKTKPSLMSPFGYFWWLIIFLYMTVSSCACLIINWYTHKLSATARNSSISMCLHLFPIVLEAQYLGSYYNLLGTPQTVEINCWKCRIILTTFSFQIYLHFNTWCIYSINLFVIIIIFIIYRMVSFSSFSIFGDDRPKIALSN